MRTAIRVLIYTYLLGFAAHPASGQTSQGGVRGTITDAGGVIPSASVQIVEDATGQVRVTVTDGTLQYGF